MATGVSGGTLPDGLSLTCEAIDEAAEAALIRACEGFGVQQYAADPTNPRSSISFGWKYDFQNDSFLPCAPIPTALRALCRSAADLAGTTSEAIIEALVNRYDPGAIIQPHCDKPVFDLVIGVSLGAGTNMVFSKPDALGGEHIPVRLPRRSIYVMRGEARHVYRHEIPATERTRWSITFRTLSPEGERLRARLASAA